MVILQDLIARKITKVFETKPSLVRDGIPGPASYFNIIIELDNSELYELGPHDITNWDKDNKLIPYEISEWEIQNNLITLDKRISQIIQRDSEVYFDCSLTLLLENNVIMEHQQSNGDQLYIDKYCDEYEIDD